MWLSFISNSRPSPLRSWCRGIVSLALLVCAALLLDRVLAFSLERLIILSEFRFSALYRGGNDAEAVIIGDSRSVHTLYAPDLETRSCRPTQHFGFNGMSFAAASLLIEDYLTMNDSPEFVVVEASMLYGRGSNNFLALLAPYMGRSAALATTINEHDEGLLPWRKIFHLYRFNSELTFRAFLYLRQNDQTWINRDRRIGEKLIENYRTSKVAQNETTSETTAAADRLLDIAEREGFDVVLVLAPYFRTFFENEASAAFLENFRVWLPQRFPRAKVVDLAELPIARDGFADPIHLNIEGALVANGALLARVPELVECMESARPTAGAVSRE